MNVILFIVVIALFVALTPGILLSLPPKGSKLVVALTHGIVFAIVLKLIYKPLKKLFSGKEGLKNFNPTSKTDQCRQYYKDIRNQFDTDFYDLPQSYFYNFNKKKGDIVENLTKLKDCIDDKMIPEIKKQNNN